MGVSGCVFRQLSVVSSGVMNSDFARSVRSHVQTCYEKLQRNFEDFKRNNKWLVDEYWRWYYKVNDLYKKVMSYPEAQQLQAALNEVVTTVRARINRRAKYQNASVWF